jgi:hypothetical protein
LSDAATRCEADLQFAGILLAAIVLFDVLFQRRLIDGAGKPRPLIAKVQDFAHFIEKLLIGVVVSPAIAVAKLDELLLPTRDQREPFASDTVVRTLLPFRHEVSQKNKTKNAAESALLDNQRSLLIRATKMNATASRPFV